MKDILRGSKISAFDGSIIANLASLMTPGRGRLLVKAARNFRVEDRQTDENHDVRQRFDELRAAPPSFRRIIRNSRLCSSIRFSILTVLPSYVFALTKS
jgi:hypothetical protein